MFCKASFVTIHAEYAYTWNVVGVLICVFVFNYTFHVLHIYQNRPAARSLAMVNLDCHGAIRSHSIFTLHVEQFSGGGGVRDGGGGEWWWRRVLTAKNSWVN